MSLQQDNVSLTAAACSCLYDNVSLSNTTRSWLNNNDSLVTSKTVDNDIININTHPLQVWIRALVIIIVTTLIILSNIINVFVLRRVDGIPRVARVCLINLGLADLAVGAVTCSLSILPAFLGQWPYGTIMCQISSVVHGSSATVSIWTLSIISVDRYIALVKPLKYPLCVSIKKVCILISLTWILAIIIFIAPIPVKHTLNYYQFSDVEIMCGLYWEYPLFGIITIAVVHVASAAVIVGCTIKIAVSICKVNKVLNTTRNGPKPVLRRRRELKAVRTLITTALTFFLFWGPYVVSVLMLSFDKTSRVPPLVEFTFVWMANSNSFINVVIYSYLYKTFRIQLRVLLVRVCPCCRYCVHVDDVDSQIGPGVQGTYLSDRRGSNVRY